MKFRVAVALLPLFVLMVTAQHSLAAKPWSNVISIDGEFEDWNQHGKTTSDPVGDSTGAFDLSHIETFVDGATIYLRFDTQASLNLQSGPTSDGMLDIRIKLDSDRTLLIGLRDRQARLVTGNQTRVIPWNEIDFAALPTYATNDFECRINLGSLNVPTDQQITLNFRGSDELTESIVLELKPPTAKAVGKPDLRKIPSGALRIASLNTLKQGSDSKERKSSIKNLFQFAGADIYCFNEALDESVFRKSCFEVLPVSFANTKNLHWSSTSGIVSRFPLTPLPFKCLEAAALIEIPGQGHLVIVSAHFTCCGYKGSKKDLRRIREVKELLADLQRLRRGDYGEQAAKAGVIILGDYNLVGSRVPLDLVNEAGFKDVLLTSPVDGSAMTWRGIDPKESFWPGRLDYVAIDQERVESRGGFILNTEQLNRFDASFASEVLGSDHSMLVIDVMLP
ncbi:MAG: hypothetical protein P8L85_18205 [Rubripirellula sp.]|nr:hypothetical protein [Rubripirellula sp.]